MKKQLILLSVVFAAAIVHARPVRGISLDRDVPRAQAVAVVKVNQVETTAKGVAFGQFRVDELNVSGTVLHAIKGDCTVGEGLSFLHRKSAPPPEQTVIVNGFSSFRFEPGHNYLLILAENEDGKLQLPAPEAFSIPEFSNELVALIPDSGEKTPPQRIVEMLFMSLMSEKENPSYSLKNLRLLQQTRLFREILREKGVKEELLRRLNQIKDISTKHFNEVAHIWLPQFGIYDHLDEAINYVLDETNAQTDRFNAISGWLCNYPEMMQVRAYQKIVDQCKDDFVRENAQERLDRLWVLPKEVEERFLRFENPSDESFSTDAFIKYLSECHPVQVPGSISAIEAPPEPEKWQNLQQKIRVRLKTAMESKQRIVRFRAALVLNHYNEKSAIPVLTESVDDKLPEIRTAAIAALGKQSVIEAYDAVVKHLTDKASVERNPEYTMPAQAACYALGKLRLQESIQPLIKALDDEDLQNHALKALNEIRGQNAVFGLGSSIMINVPTTDSKRNRTRSDYFHLRFPEDPGEDPVKWKRWGAWYLLNDEQINARLYPDWQKDPAAYTMVKLEIKDHSVQFDTLKDNKGSVVVILPEEQVSPLLQTLLHRQLYASSADQSNHFQIPYYDNLNRLDIQEKLNIGTSWFFNDAQGAGNLINDALVHVYLYKWKGPRIKLGEYKTDGSIIRYAMMGNIGDTEFIVSHPDYGRARAQVHRDYDKLHLVLPLVPKDSNAGLRAVWGYVVDPDNQPVAGVELYCENVRTLGEGLINGDHNFCRARGLTDENGFFRYYMPPLRRDGPATFGELIPPKSRYLIRAEAPSDPSLFPFGGEIPNGEETSIMLQHKAITDLHEDIEQAKDGRFHTFRFYGQHGELTTEEELNRLSAEIHRPDEPKIKLSAAHLKDGVKVPNGIIKTTYRNTHPGDAVQFEPLEVTDESPEELIFSVPLLTYTGRVFHARTDEPMEGVFVIAKQGNREGNLSMISEEEWDALHALPPNPSLDDPALKAVSRIYGFQNVVRTDSEGRFEMDCPEGDTPYGFTFFEQNYIGLMHRRYQLKPDENGIVKIPAKKMYPAAKVVFQANSEKEHISIGPKWVINKKKNPAWVKEFLKNDDQRERHFTYDHWVEKNEVQSVYVPADVTLKFQLRTPYDEDFDDYTFPQEISLAQGQTLDLGDCDFSKNIRIYVKVVDSRGNPVVGAPVRKKIRNHYYTPSVSDENGLSEFMVPPGKQGEFAVTYWGHEGGPQMHLVETVSFQTESRQDEGSIFTLPLSDEMVELLFGD